MSFRYSYLPGRTRLPPTRTLKFRGALDPEPNSGSKARASDHGPDVSSKARFRIQGLTLDPRQDVDPGSDLCSWVIPGRTPNPEPDFEFNAGPVLPYGFEITELGQRKRVTTTARL